MKQLNKGSFFGFSKQKISYNGLIIADTECTSPAEVPWHYHENPYFTYFMGGHLVEVNKKESFTCTPGTLLFHNWQEPHYNTKHSKYTHFLHVELERKWFEKQLLQLSEFEGSSSFINIEYGQLFLKIYKELSINDSATSIAIDGLILQVLSKMKREHQNVSQKNPAWVDKAKEIIYYKYAEALSLENISLELGITPTHLSQMFPKYFNVNFGDYIRSIRIEKATLMLSNPNYSMSDITYKCGFADQSHFIRLFKTTNGITPNQYRKIVLAP